MPCRRLSRKPILVVARVMVTRFFELARLEMPMAGITVPAPVIFNNNNHDVPTTTTIEEETATTPSETMHRPLNTAPTTPSRRSSSPFPSSLVTFNQQQLGSFSDQRRFQNSFCSPTSYINAPSLHTTTFTRTEEIASSRNCGSSSQESHRTSDKSITRFWKHNVCYPQTQWRLSSRVQPAQTESIYQCSSFQDGNLTTCRQALTTRRFPHFSGFTRRFSPYIGPSHIKKISTLPVAKSALSVQDYPFWPFRGSLALHSFDSTNPQVGSFTRHKGIGILGRLANHGTYGGRSSRSHQSNDLSSSTFGLVGELQKVSPPAHPGNRTFGLHAGHTLNDYKVARHQTSRSQAVDQTDLDASFSVCSQDSQPDNADQGSNHGNLSSSHVHTRIDEVQESLCTPSARLGSSATSSSRMHRRIDMVESQPREVERTINHEANTIITGFCGRQQSGMGRCSTRSSGAGHLDTSGSTTIDQLEGIESCTTHSSIVSHTVPHLHSHPIRQHNSSVIHQQTRRHSFGNLEQIGHNDLGNVPSASSPSTSTTYPRDPQLNRRSSFSTNICQESVATAASNLPSTSTSMGCTRRRSLCGPHHSITSEVCGVENRPISIGNRRLHVDMESVQETTHSPTLESDSPSIAEGQERESHGHSHSTLVAECDMVPTSQADGNTSSNHSQSENTHSCHIISYPQSMDKPTLEAFRVECLRRKFRFLEYHDNTVNHLLATNRSLNARSYRKFQLEFLSWCITQQVDPNHFTMATLINFLSTMRSRYSVNSLPLMRTAIIHFHVQPSLFQHDSQLEQLFNIWREEAPPVPIERPPVDLTPSFAFCRTIESSAHSSLYNLAHKTVFLLAITGFLRPSDLHRINLQDSFVDGSRCLHLSVVAPKEKRNGRRIVKVVRIKPYPQDATLCPVTAFEALRDHPNTVHRPPGALFISTTNARVAASCDTISRWLRNVVSRSINSSSSASRRPAMRSVASDLALQHGIPLDDVITHGNWASSMMFDNHYRRSRHISSDITSSVLPGSSSSSSA